MENKLHTPVMLNEVIEHLNLTPGKIIVDATIGTGGHSRAILEHIMPAGKLIGIDRDQESLAVASERLRDFADACEFVHGNFTDVDKILERLNIKNIDGILFDLGLSSFQLENPRRGFSFQYEGPLDMRLDNNSYISAYDLINNLTQEEISNLLWTFGQERWHNRIARLLVEERQRHPIATTLQLSNIVVRATPYRYRHYRIHPATRTFQAIRIAVNRELEALEVAITKAVKLLNKSGRICVISFHSLEDRIVKLGFRALSSKKELDIITSKPLTPTRNEIKENSSSRSAKFRVAERI
ncbi:MAG: 16S rRNA (cytosine(1402)-N(4))-methyltransferase RsmH [Candidatus Omnitrophica bacterium]|nr:16S rRNA (cytosine(1402)-N(4))-methyltransferase RsmH [Candidatus Omnitrophota bacterium]MBU4473590.1 16S rRNA (cytosine(1402)-N(4))-methyltransferase RsmH [Candidatus Omnitrophota bacterium]MCG2706307.1 16S rRNA (cytosine(1402)-N(4))-methyltransferase RsmH [Candidatus Omnitrophota bacterium]